MIYYEYIMKIDTKIICAKNMSYTNMHYCKDKNIFEYTIIGYDLNGIYALGCENVKNIDKIMVIENVENCDNIIFSESVSLMTECFENHVVFMNDIWPLIFTGLKKSLKVIVTLFKKEENCSIKLYTTDVTFEHGKIDTTGIIFHSKNNDYFLKTFEKTCTAYFTSIDQDTDFLPYCIHFEKNIEYDMIELVILCNTYFFDTNTLPLMTHIVKNVLYFDLSKLVKFFPVCLMDVKLFVKGNNPNYFAIKKHCSKTLCEKIPCLSYEHMSQHHFHVKKNDEIYVISQFPLKYLKIMCSGIMLCDYDEILLNLIKIKSEQPSQYVYLLDNLFSPLSETYFHYSMITDKCGEITCYKKRQNEFIMKDKQIILRYTS